MPAERFPDDALKIRAAVEGTRESRSFYVEFRARRPDGKFRWLAGKGQVLTRADSAAKVLRGTFYEIDERKQLEAKLLALNETLEARLAELREEARTLEVLNRTGIAIGAELDLERLVQIVTDAGVELSGAQFGAFFYNVVRPDGEAYTLYSLSAPTRSVRQVSDATQYRGVRTDLSRDGNGSFRRYSRTQDTVRASPTKACRPAICRFEVISLCPSSPAGVRCWEACFSGTPSRGCSVSGPNGFGRRRGASGCRDR